MDWPRLQWRDSKKTNIDERPKVETDGQATYVPPDDPPLSPGSPSAHIPPLCDRRLGCHTSCKSMHFSLYLSLSHSCFVLFFFSPSPVRRWRGGLLTSDLNRPHAALSLPAVTPPPGLPAPCAPCVGILRPKGHLSDRTRVELDTGG